MRNDPNGEAFVFRDFERSKILALRQAIERSPLRISAQFFGIVACWTILMSAGAGLHGVNSIALNLAPHVALYTAAVGLFIYPVRLAWVPLLSFVAAFACPFFQPFVRTTPWYLNQYLTTEIVVMLFVFNIAGAIAVAGVLRAFFSLSLRRIRPHSADLFLSLFSYALFIIIMLAQVRAMQGWGNTLPDQIRLAMGFGPEFETLVLNRVFRGGVVLAAFLLAATEIPTRRELLIGLLVVPVFPLVGWAHLSGIGLFPMLDIVLVALVLFVAMPVASGIVCGIIGFAIYAAMTGYFLNDQTGGSPFEVYLTQYSIFALFILIYVEIFRSRTKHLLVTLSGNIRRLERVRDFAGVGLFSANLSTDSFRVDSAAGRLLGVGHSGRLVAFLHGFDVSSRDRLTDTLAKSHIVGETLVLNVAHSEKSQDCVVRLFLWSEISPIGEKVAYGLILDETEEAARQKEQVAALAALSAREEKQRQIFSMISHEVRTPASVIAMLIEDLPPETPATMRRQLHDSSQHLLSVLSNMRQAVNPEQNLPVRLDRYEPKTLAEGVVASLRPAAETANMLLHLDLDENASVQRMGDTTRMRQVLSNLVRNALLHSQGSTVELRFRSRQADDGQVLSIWTVQDDGRGIDPADVERIFEPFERGGQSTERRIDGSGLGLFIARSAVDVLGGRLIYRGAEGGGAAFEVTLPETLCAPAPADTLAEPDAWGDGGPPPRAPRHLSILLAEDNPMVAEVVGARLRRDFDSVRLVTNGQELLDTWQNPRPDVVISDLFMPLMDGDKAATALRAAGFTGPLIGLTAAAVTDEAARFEAAGATAVMFKPLDVDALHQILLQAYPHSGSSENA